MSGEHWSGHDPGLGCGILLLVGIALLIAAVIHVVVSLVGTYLQLVRLVLP